MSRKELSHLDGSGRARMVDVGGKPHTRRTATARGSVLMNPETLRLIFEGNAPKGDVLAVARVAGISAAKKTPDLIPLCHPLALAHVQVDIEQGKGPPRLEITATASAVGPTGVEMEALTAVAASALTVYDMCKSVDREMSITDIVLVEKKGGRSGDYRKK